jgi:hypothetical protein
MNTQRVTVSLPTYIYEDMLLMLGKGKISSFVAEAVEDRMLDYKINDKDPVEAFLAYKKKLPKLELTSRQIKKIIEKGRM